MTKSLAAASSTVVALLATGLAAPRAQQAPERQDDSFRFKSGVELINVTATVSDQNGRFVSGLRKEDFVVYEDNLRQTVTHFSAERVPVSLGVVLDTSGSMAGEKIGAARSALDRFLYELLERNDEIFLYRFSDAPVLVQGWTTDRQQVARALGRIAPNGGTALYDGVAEAVPLVLTGHNQKKALVVISDGNDTSSHLTVREVKQSIRESEVLVYAIGIDGEDDPLAGRAPQPTPFPPPRQPPPRLPVPQPFPPMRRPPGVRPPGFQTLQRPGRVARTMGERVNVAALRDLTDDSGGRTEIVRDSSDLDPATANIAAELSQQYYLGYPAPGKRDGLWHSIRVDVTNPAYRVRARRGYVAN